MYREGGRETESGEAGEAEVGWEKTRFILKRNDKVNFTFTVKGKFLMSCCCHLLFLPKPCDAPKVKQTRLVFCSVQISHCMFS